MGKEGLASVCMAMMGEGTATLDKLAFSEALADKEAIMGPVKAARGEVEFRGVSFTYDADKGVVLRDVSFVARPGETVALVGRSGSGKSTLVSLLPRFYDVTDGAILLDGVDPAKILCITFTKAAAANMATRSPTKRTLWSNEKLSNGPGIGSDWPAVE